MARVVIASVENVAEALGKRSPTERLVAVHSHRSMTPPENGLHGSIMLGMTIEMRELYFEEVQGG